MNKFADAFSKIKPLLRDKRILAAIAGVLVLATSIIVMAQRDSRVATGKDPEKTRDTIGDELLPGEAAGPIDVAGGPTASANSPGTKKSSTGGTGGRAGVGVPVPKSGTIPLGVDFAKQEIKVVMYWREDSRSSQYLAGTGASGETVDDSKAFDALVKYINKHAKGSGQLMGGKIGMGNWLIKPIIVSMNDPAGINAGTIAITKEHKPFAAITARGSLSTETCPAFAAAGIHNFATLHPYVPNIERAYKGYCIPNAISWDQQIDITVNYMKWHKTTPYVPGARTPNCPVGQASCPRVYGFLYSEYPGLKEQGPIVADRLGIPAERRASLPAGLSSAAGQPSANALARFVNAGVNTVIMPDGGSPLAFTHSAGQWEPDYYIWPCSGQDTTGYTRLLPPKQWDNASGLSCYDDTFDAELTIDSGDRQTQWYAAYKEMNSSGEAPSSTHLVYAALQPLVVGVSNLGDREFTVENFRSALNEFQPYRYNGVSGRTTAADNLLLLMGNSSDGSIWGDMARVSWSPAAENPFSYLDNRRYTSNQSFP